MNITYYLTYDLPVPYRNIKIYPVTVKDYMLFNNYVQCLTVDKNVIPDVKIISMTNLQYFFYSAQQNIEKYPYLLWFDRLLSLCLKDEKSFENIEDSIKRYSYDETEMPFFTISEEKYASNDFEELKSIISEQNLVELPDKTISKEVRDSLEEAQKYKEKISGVSGGSFEDYIIAMSIATGWTLDYIYSMSVRKFIKSITRLDNLIHYQIYLAASMSGMVEFKDKSFIKHWLTNLDKKDKYGNVSVDLDALQDKISLESAKK